MGRKSTFSPLQSQGFTLLEAIIALTLLGIALVPMVSFISQSADQLTRAADANERSVAMRAAIAALDPINPMEEPAGELPLGRNVTAEWNSQVILPPNDGPMFGSGLAGFRVGFYDMRVSLMRDAAEPWIEFNMRKVGYERIGSGRNLFNTSGQP